MVVSVKLLHVDGDVFVKTLDSVIELAQRKIIVLGIYSLELTAVNGDVRLGKELQSHAKLIELLIYFGDSLLVILAEIRDTYNVGWHFNKRFEGKGFACEAAAGLLDYLFREAGARRIYGFVEDDNIRSKRLCERLGMRREGCFKEFVTFVNNPDGSPKYEDTCVYAILEKEWNTIRQW